PTISPVFDVDGNHRIRSTIFYTQTGTLSFVFTDPKNFHQKRVDVDPLTFVQIDPGVEYSVANLQNGNKNNDPATSLQVTVLDPKAYPGSCGFTLFPPVE